MFRRPPIRPLPIRPLPMLLLALCLTPLPAAAHSDDPPAADSSPSPSDLTVPSPTVVVEVASGREHRGKLLRPAELEVAFDGGLLKLAPAGLGELTVASDGQAEATLRGGARLSGRLLTPGIVLSAGRSSLEVSRGELRRIAVVGSEPGAVAEQTSAGEGHVLLYGEPDVFYGCRGVPTWHPRPILLRAADGAAVIP